MPVALTLEVCGKEVDHPCPCTSHSRHSGLTSWQLGPECIVIAACEFCPIDPNEAL